MDSTAVRLVDFSCETRRIKIELIDSGYSNLGYSDSTAPTQVDTTRHKHADEGKEIVQVRYFEVGEKGKK